MDENELRAQAAYQAIAIRLGRANDEIANQAAEIAVMQQRLNDLNAQLLEAKTPKPGA